MDKVYYLDLQTLLEYLQGQSALLSTGVNVPGQRAPYMGHVFFQNATIIGCLIKTPDGTNWREGEPAYQLLKARAEWRVRMDLDIEQTFRLMKHQSDRMQQGIPSSAGPAPPPPTEYAPRPMMSLEPALLQPFSAKERLILRLVFALVNGQRTSTQIKMQLRLPGETVDEALTRLYSLGVIE